MKTGQKVWVIVAVLAFLSASQGWSQQQTVKAAAQKPKVISKKPKSPADKKAFVAEIVKLVRDPRIDVNTRRRIADSALPFLTEETAPLLVPALNDPNVEEGTKRNLLNALISKPFRSLAKPIIPVLANARLPFSVRLLAARALGMTYAREVIPNLKPLLTSDDVDAQSAAAVALAMLGDESEAVVDALIYRCRWHQPTYEMIPYLGYARSKKSIPVLLQFMEYPDRSTVNASYEALKSITLESLPGDVNKWKEWWAKNQASFAPVAPTAKNIPMLIEKMTRKNDNTVRLSAGRVLSRVGLQAAPAVLDVMQRDSSSHGAAAEFFLPLVPDSIPIMVRSLSIDSGGVYRTMQSMLQRVGTPAVPELIKAVGNRNTDMRIRIRAAEVLGNMRAVAAADALTKALDETDTNLRSTVITALGKLYVASARAALHKVFATDVNREICMNAAQALAVIDEANAKDALITLAKYGDNTDFAARKLKELRITEAFPVLVEVFRYKRGGRSYEVLDAIVKLGGKKALGLATELATDRDIRMAREAIHLLGEIGGDDSIPVLRKALLDPNKWDYARRALYRIGTPATIAAADAALYYPRLGYGFVKLWAIVGPFDNKQNGGFDKKFPPEAGVNLGATYGDGKVRYQRYETRDSSGVVSLRSIYRKNDALAYAVAAVRSPSDRKVLICLGAEQMAKVWVNGQQVFASAVPTPWQLDQFTFPAQLKKGENRIVVKVCHTTGDWRFSVRLLDEQERPMSDVEIIDLMPKKKK